MHGLFSIKDCLFNIIHILYPKSVYVFLKIFSGWLRKQGGNYKTLKTRWFEVRGDQIYYFRAKDVSNNLKKVS